LIGLEHMGLDRQFSIPITTVFIAGVRLLAIRYALNQSSQ
jgi:hypothetical protein